VISLGTYMPRINLAGGVQTILSTPKLGPPPKSARATTRT